MSETSADAPTSLTRRQILGLVALGLGVLIVANDLTAFTVALPAMQRSLDADLSTIQWIVNGYALVFGVAIVTGGRLADLYGRRRIFLAGAAIFGACSLIAGLSDEVVVVLVARAVMGLGGALLWPSTLGMTFSILPPGRAGLAGGVFVGVAGFGNAMGPLLGGILTDTLGWHWVFLANLPVAALGVAAVLLAIDRDPPPAEEQRLDLVGTVILSIALFSLLFALDLGVAHGWTSPLVLGLFAASAIGLVVFGLVERSLGERALVPESVMRTAQFRWCAVAMLLSSAVAFGAFVYLPQFMSGSLHYSAAASGAGMLPLMLSFAGASIAAGSLYGRLGAKVLVTGGAALLCIGMLMLSRLDAGTEYLGLVPGMIVVGAGNGLFNSSLTTAAITALDARHVSLGGAIIFMCRIAGGAIGLGFNTAIVSTSSSLPSGIGRAFLVNGVLAAGSVLVALLFVHGQREDGPQSSTRRRHGTS